MSVTHAHFIGQLGYAITEGMTTIGGGTPGLPWACATWSGSSLAETVRRRRAVSLGLALGTPVTAARG